MSTIAGLITGASSGIGNKMAFLLAQRGHQVMGCGKETVAEAIALSPNLNHPNIGYMQADVTSEADMIRVVEAGMARFGETRPERLIGITSAGVSFRNDPAKVKLMWDINHVGTHNFLRAIRPHLRPTDRLATLSSMVADAGTSYEDLPNHLPGDKEYAKTKFAAWQAAREITECEAVGIAPGAIRTPLTKGEAIFTMLAVAAVKALFDGRLDESYKISLATYLGAPLASSPAGVLLQMLQGEQVYYFDPESGQPLEDINEVLAKPKNAQLKKQSLNGIIAQAINARTAPQAFDNVTDGLEAMNIVIGPAVVAKKSIELLLSGVIPDDRFFRVYGRGDQAPITHLMTSLGDTFGF